MRRYVIFIVVCLVHLLSTFTTYAASVALSQIVKDLNTTVVLVGWVLSGYSLVYTIAMPLAGKISEALGRKTAFTMHIMLFAIGSVLSAMATNIYVLIGARILQAFGGGGFMPNATGVASDEFPETRWKYIGLLSNLMPIGMIIGPNIGGWMTQAFGWRSVFWLNVPFSLLALVVLQFLMRRGEKKRASISSIDFLGAGLLFGSIFALLLAVTELGRNAASIPWVTVGIFFALAVALFIPLFQRERRAKEPIIDFELLSRRPFLAANIYNFVYGFVGLGVLSLIPLYAVSVYDMSVLASGVLLTPRSVGMIAASTVTSFALMRWGYRKPLIVGSAVMVIGLAVLALQPQGIGVAGLMIGLSPLLLTVVGLCGLGQGISAPAANNACLELMPDKVATITGLRGMFRNMGSAIGVAVATALIHSISDVQRAFFVVLFGSAVITLLSMPTIFGMPSSTLAPVSRPKPQVSPAKT